jgi:Peptidase family S41
MSSPSSRSPALLIACLLACTAQPQAKAQTAPAQTNAAAAQNLQEFDFMVDKISVNYAGYDTKTAGEKRAALDALTARLRKKVASSALSDVELTGVLKEWLGFFGDGHTAINAMQSDPSAADGTKTPRELAAAVPRLDWTEASVIQRLSALGDQRDSVEGIWSISGDHYRLAILRTAADEFAAVVLSSTAENWSPGMVKATLNRDSTSGYRIDYRAGDFSNTALKGAVLADGGLIDTGDYGTWQREWPAVADRERLAKLFPADDFFIRRLSPDTLWLRLPNFNDSNANKVANLIKDNAAALATTANLVIDTRNNGGGSDFVYAPLIPYLYTRPIYEIGIEMRASRDNIALRQAIADGLKNNAEAADVVRQLNAQNVLMAKNIGGYVQPDARPFSISKLDQVLPFPKHVAILIDNAGSTGEQFLLAARQSRKVTLFGKANSAGVLDFANVVSMTSPSGRYQLQWATSRSLRLPDEPVDDGGIAPDIRIPESEPDPVTFAQDWLERRVE